MLLLSAGLLEKNVSDVWLCAVWVSRLLMPEYEFCDVFESTLFNLTGCCLLENHALSLEVGLLLTPVAWLCMTGGELSDIGRARVRVADAETPMELSGVSDLDLVSLSSLR